MTRPSVNMWATLLRIWGRPTINVRMMMTMVTFLVTVTLQAYLHISLNIWIIFFYTHMTYTSIDLLSIIVDNSVFLWIVVFQINASKRLIVTPLVNAICVCISSSHVINHLPFSFGSSPDIHPYSLAPSNGLSNYNISTRNCTVY